MNLGFHPATLPRVRRRWWLTLVLVWLLGAAPLAAAIHALGHDSRPDVDVPERLACSLCVAYVNLGTSLPASAPPPAAFVPGLVHHVLAPRREALPQPLVAAYRSRAPPDR